MWCSPYKAGSLLSWPCRKKPGQAKAKQPIPVMICLTLLLMILSLLGLYVVHCVHASADMYSSPSIVLQSPRQDGSVYVFDDFREAYGW